MPTIGQTLRQTRHARGKSLKVVADRAGISPGYLSLLEHGKRALNSRSLIARLANALEIAPTDLAHDMIVDFGELPQDRELAEVRRALMAVSLNAPGGDVVPTDVLRVRVDEVLRAQQECRH